MDNPAFKSADPLSSIQPHPTQGPLNSGSTQGPNFLNRPAENTAQPDTVPYKVTAPQGISHEGAILARPGEREGPEQLKERHEAFMRGYYPEGSGPPKAITDAYPGLFFRPGAEPEQPAGTAPQQPILQRPGAQQPKGMDVINGTTINRTTFSPEGRSERIINLGERPTIGDVALWKQQEEREKEGTELQKAAIAAKDRAPNELEYVTAGSRVGTPQEQPGDKEKKAAIDYKTEEAKKVAEGRGKGYAEFRPQAVADSFDNNNITTMTQAEIAEGNKKEPGRFKLITPSEYAKAENRTALLGDIRMNIDATKESLGGLTNDFDQKQRFKIYEAMKVEHPSGAIGNLIAGEFGKSLTPDQQQYLVDISALQENAMAMRSVLGMGQGSEDLRNAIRATIPSAGTYSKSYASKQLKKFDQILNRLESGVLKVNLRTDTGGKSKEKKGEESESGDYQIKVGEDGTKIRWKPGMKAWETF
jgi:hypothetical protein